ncbi:nitrile hydratase accessory protein [Pseudotabrizicola sp. 4114]|uniref:nitrile hydratase accessory protein n=1 Tax=Pseudotabrizicola sp. 4114 TaxID=2817731 RepID=UPI00285F6EA1|nr:nitrile hydratase accessory protein [Pseudorhodobacter sp. 4114]
MRIPLGSNDEPIFHAPWQARLFALTVMLVQRGLFTWPDWTKALSAKCTPDELIRDSPGSSETHAESYYMAWSHALSELLVERGVTDLSDVMDCAEAWQRAAMNTPHGSPIEL